MNPLDKKIDKFLDQSITFVFGVGFAIAFWVVVLSILFKILSLVF